MTDQPHTPNDELVAKVRAIAIDLDGDYRNGSWNEGAAKLFDQMIIQVEAAAEQRGMRLAQEAIAGDQTVERARHRVGDILSTAQVLHVIDQAIKNRADQEGAQGE